MIIDKKGTIEIESPKTITVGFYVEANKRLRRRLKDNYAMVVPAVELDEGAGTQYGQWLNQWISTVKPEEEDIKRAVAYIVATHPKAKFLRKQPKLLDSLDLTLESLQKYTNEIQRDYRVKKDKTANEEDADIEVISPNVVKTNNFAAAYFLHGSGAKYDNQMPWCGGRSQSLYNNYGGSNRSRYIVFPDGPDTSYKINGQDVPWSNNAFVISVNRNGTFNNINDPGNYYPNDGDYDREGAVSAIQILNEAVGLDLDVSVSAEWDDYGIDAGDWPGWEAADAAHWSNHGFEDEDDAAPWMAAGFDDPEEAYEWKTTSQLDADTARVLLDNEFDANQGYELKNYLESEADAKKAISVGIFAEEIISAIDLETIGEAWLELANDVWSSLDPTQKIVLILATREAYDITDEQIEKISDHFTTPDITALFDTHLDLNEIDQWFAEGRDPDLALAGMTVEQYQQLQAKTDMNDEEIVEFGQKWLTDNTAFTGEPVAAIAWDEARIDPQTAAQWASHGFSAEDARRWIASGWKTPDNAKRQISYGKTYDDPKAWDPKIDAFHGRQLRNNVMDYHQAAAIYKKLDELGVWDTNSKSTPFRSHIGTQIQYVADLLGWDDTFKLIDEIGLDKTDELGTYALKQQAAGVSKSWLPRFKELFSPDRPVKLTAQVAGLTSHVYDETFLDLMKNVSERDHDKKFNSFERNPETTIRNLAASAAGLDPEVIPDKMDANEVIEVTKLQPSEYTTSRDTAQMLQQMKESGWTREHVSVLAGKERWEVTSWMFQFPNVSVAELRGWVAAADKRGATAIKAGHAKKEGLSPHEWAQPEAPESQVELLPRNARQIKADAAKDSYMPTESMRNNAKRGLEYRKRPGGKGGTEVGVNTARVLSSGKNLSRSMVAKMHSFFSRHDGNQKVQKGKKPHEDAGYVAWLLWGGDSGKTWAANIMDREKKAQQAPEFQRDLTEVLAEVRRLIDERGPHPSLIAVMRGLKQKIELEKSFGLREAKRMRCLDSTQRRTEVEMSEVKPGDKVQFTSEFQKTGGPYVESGEFGTVQAVGAESLVVETLGSIASDSGVEVSKCMIDAPVDHLILILHNEDPRA